MKVAALIFTMFLAAVSAAGQVAALQNDSPEVKSFLAEIKAGEILKTANYRSVWTKEFVAERSKEAKLQERMVSEVIQPNKARSVVEQFSDTPSREEIIRDGKAFYIRQGDKPWQRFNGDGGRSVQFVQMPYRIQFRFLPSVEFEGGKADFYEYVTIRTSNKSSKKDAVVVRYVITTRSWFSTDGKILKKIEETTVEGRVEMVRETTTYEYDPKDLKIEAPAIK